ncbi:MAG: AAA family ATPase [Microcystaceae cyanobacterium]
MKLLSIKLCNFRQFYGETPEIIIASEQQNTTVIHGNNGAGKTTILNGFTWVLYEKFTDAFAASDLLVNKRAITEGNYGTSVDCWVRIEFEHDHKRYQVKRHCYACRDQEGKIQYSQSKFYMLVGNESGKWYPPVEQPDDIINQILPESLHHYFFFDGEHIDHIFRKSESQSIAEDTKDLLGVKVLDRAIDHLKKVKRTFTEEMSKIGDINSQKLSQKHLTLDKEKASLQQKEDELKRQLTDQEVQKQQLNQQILSLSGSTELKQLKLKLDKQEKILRQNLLEAKDIIKQLISSQGYTVLTFELVGNLSQLITNLRQKGELPSGIKKQFVQQLLDRQRCICGTELKEGLSAYEQVKSWREKAGIADVEEAAIRLEADTQIFTLNGANFWQTIDQQQGKINQYRLELSQVESELDKISSQFRNYPDQDIKTLQQQLDTLEESLREGRLEQGLLQQQKSQLEKEIHQLEKQISKQKLKENKQVLAQRRLTATQDAIERIQLVRKRLENQFRRSLEQRVREIFSEISFTPYIPRLSSDYQLTLMENTSGIAVPVAASTGENQILSLSFIGAIIDRVRLWSEKNTLMGIDSSTFPIVMDSPFGSLDEIYRRQVAKSIPKLANQLVILVTKTQWRGEVQQETSPYIGREYVLTYYSPKADCEEDYITIHGKNYPLVKRSVNGFEYTEIQAV